MILKELRKQKNIKQKDIANTLKISTVNYNRFENEKSEPDIETLKKIADYFEVSIDTLVEHNSPLIDLGTLTLAQKQLFDLIKNCSDLVCVKAEAYINGLLEKEKDINAIKNLYKGN